MVVPLILVRDNNGDLHDQEGHLRNAAEGRAEEEEVNYIGGAGFQGNQGGNRNSYGNKRRESARRRFQGRKFDEFRRVTLVSIDTIHRASIDIHQLKSIDRSTRASIDNAYVVNRVL
ncbi:hypothetical protein F2Q70_00043407 [Brassica cretica]|uniref:Uncharacterized protein n=1 Tax=Brassica cretica TaxID=69181 RepID=A0A8S9KG42_BRACR|nr:hypothetical protein F2Q70_00043407 [Brassica cretica]